MHPPGDSRRDGVGQSCHGGALALKNCVVASGGAFDNDNDTGTVGPASDVVVVVGVIVVVVVVVAPSSLFLGNISQVWTVCSNILVI